MDMYNVSEYGHADAYLIQSTNSNSHLVSPLLEPFETMYNEGAREFVVDQGLYYPSAANYGYICTGLESPGDWDDHHRIFGVDGQDIQFMGAQTESLPYVYYTPSYGYSQSPYNPYNPYIPGAMIGVDGSYVGAQQYYIPVYENVTTSSPSYIPMVVQTGPEVHSNSVTDPFIHTAGSTANRVDVSGLKRNFSPASATFTLNPVRSGSNQTNSFTSSEGLKNNGGPSKLSMAHGAVPSNSFTSAQGRDAQVIDNVSHGKALSNRNQLKVALPSGNGLSNFGSGGNGRVYVDKVRPKSSVDKIASDDNGNPDPLIEQNRGPRINKSKSHLIVKSYTTMAGNCDAQGNITINIDQYNKDDFPIEYENAKFFVIKSYSEDDVHKSIKYNVWSSTPNGNKKLNSAYEDAQRIASGDPKGCPIFLFFSVNASGQFCGVAEMTGQVDFHRDMDFWQQDKWSGSFPVKWRIVKDVPNPSFRHIILENNEHKPVTNSRDTQEIRYRKGLEMLKVFKNHVSKTSLLDDFLYYENRQKMLQEEKARLIMKSYGAPLFVPVLDPPRKLHSFLNLPSGEDEQITKHSNLHSPDTSVVTPSKQTTIDASVGNAGTQSKQTTSDANAGNPGSTQVEQVVNGKATEGDILKIGSLTINPKQAEPVGASASGVTTTKSGSDRVVTVGSMPVKVNGFAEPSVVLTVGTIPLDPRALRVEEGVSKNLTKTGSKKT